MEGPVEFHEAAVYRNTIRPFCGHSAKSRLYGEPSYSSRVTFYDIQVDYLTPLPSVEVGKFVSEFGRPC
jgi:hypothetical protein